MKIKDMKSILATNKFDNYECNFKIKSKGPQAPEWFKVWIIAFDQKINQRFDQLEARIDRIESRIDHLEHRIDNLVAKNNLKE